VHCNAVELLERLLDRGIIPDVLTDQTSAHDPLEGYVPSSCALREAAACARPTPRSTRS
jgi:urocanate hydratase